MPEGSLQVGLRDSAEALLTANVRRLEVTGIAAISPSLAEVLRLCALRAGLSRATGVTSFVLGNPKAWLGVAYHEVLAGAGDRSGTDVERANEAAWASAVSRQYERAKLHLLDNRFGAPERWPGYYLARAMALMRAREIASVSPNIGWQGATYRTERLREQWLSGADGKVVGRPDLIRDDAIIDYKTGDIYEDGDGTIAKASYVRQLKIYAFLVKERTGRWPNRGIILPMEGSPLEVELAPPTCESAVTDALNLLDRYNQLVNAGATPQELANPSAEACRWCQYQLFCPAFWEAANESWSESLGAAASGGSATASPRQLHGGAAMVLDIVSDQGTVLRGAVTLAPVNPQIHAAIKQVRTGMRVRAVGLARRADGTLVPNMRTVFALSADIPTVVVSGAKHPQR